MKCSKADVQAVKIENREKRNISGFCDSIL
jgi:hypothetical protein